MKAELSCNGKPVELNDFVVAFLGNLIFGLIATLQGVPEGTTRVEVERKADELKISCDDVVIEWFMEYPRHAVGQVIDAAVHTLKGCGGATTYTLGVGR